MDAEGAHYDIQVGETEGANDPGDILWRTTDWSAGAEDVLFAKVAKRAVVLPDKIVTFDRQGAALGGHAEGQRPGGGCKKGGENVTGVKALLPAGVLATKAEKRAVVLSRMLSSA